MDIILWYSKLSMEQYIEAEVISLLVINSNRR